MLIEIHIVNAFTDGEKGGNPAGVVLDADRLTREQKQVIASQVGVSETAFVSLSHDADFKLEFFTPERQIAHCGHATIATFSLLKTLGRIGDGLSSKETIDGTRSIFLDGDNVFMEQKPPFYTPLTADESLTALKAIGLTEDKLIGGLRPTIVNTGNSFLILPIQNEKTLLGLQPNEKAIDAISEQFNLVGFYPFTLETKAVENAAASRMFAPRFGIKEEAATGMAAGTLASFLYDKLEIKRTTILIEQGHLMTPPSPSLLKTKLNIEDGSIKTLMVGGHAQLMKSFHLPMNAKPVAMRLPPLSSHDLGK